MLIVCKVPTTDGAPCRCLQWWDHAEAVARLEAARQTWMALSTAGSGSVHPASVMCLCSGDPWLRLFWWSPWRSNLISKTIKSPFVNCWYWPR
ncbi:MAG: DUF4913 domain-containing protein [Pseudonocardiaceae bacterium]